MILMAATPYDDAKKTAETLSPADRLRLVTDLLKGLNGGAEGQPLRSVMDLKGLGKELWQGVDLADYLGRERASWNG